MGPSKHIKKHDFISGKPKTMFSWFTGGICDTIEYLSSNPCREITMGVDPIDCNLQEGGYQHGELSVVMSPPGRIISATDYSRMVDEMLEHYNPTIINLDYQHLYPEIQRIYNILPNTHALGITEQEIINNNNLR